MLRRTEGSSKEEQIYQKEQILAELQVGVVVYPDDVFISFSSLSKNN